MILQYKSRQVAPKAELELDSNVDIRTYYRDKTAAALGKRIAELSPIDEDEDANGNLLFESQALLLPRRDYKELKSFMAQLATGNMNPDHARRSAYILLSQIFGVLD